MRHLTSTQIRFCDDTFSSHALHEPDVLLRWFVVTPFGHSVFVENEIKAYGLRKTYDSIGYDGCSIVSEELEIGEELIPF
jgi:hypothetical protein